MENKNFTTSIIVNASAHNAFSSINLVTKWWTENLKGHSEKPGDVFTVQFGEVHLSTQKIIEFIPDRKVVWFVTDSELNFIVDRQEWTNTKIVFDLSEQDDKTIIQFTHEGLVPDYECFNACSNAWADYLQNSLKNLINTGRGNPTPKEVMEKSKI
jgi:Activator of Hsp90 ATPase homolog 1-like protein